MAHTVVRVLAFFHQCGSSSIHPSVDSICELSLLLVLLFSLRGFSPCSPVFPSPPKPTFPILIRIGMVDEEQDHYVVVLPLNRYLLIYLSIFLFLYSFS